MCAAARECHLADFVVLGFVVVAFLATALRFMPRHADGRRRLPAIIDQSVGMYLIRRLRGGSVDVVEEEDLQDETPPAGLRASAGFGAGIAAGGGYAGAPRPTMPSRFVVSRSSDRSRLVARPVFAGPTAARPPVVGDARPRPASALALQRRIAGSAAVAVMIVAIFGVAIGPHTLEGAVLSATGTPPPPSSTPTTAPSPTPVSTVAPASPPAAP